MQTIGTKCSGSHISSALPHSQIFRTVIDIVLKSSFGFSIKSSRRCRVSVQCLPRCYTGHPPAVPLQELRALVTPGELTETRPELLKLSLHEVTLCSYNFDEIVVQSPREQFHRQKCLLSLTCSFHPPLKAVATNHLFSPVLSRMACSQGVVHYMAFPAWLLSLSIIIQGFPVSFHGSIILLFLSLHNVPFNCYQNLFEPGFGGAGIQGHSQLCVEFKASLSYTRLCLKNPSQAEQWR